MSDISNEELAVDLSALRDKMKTSTSAALSWSLQPTIFPVKYEGSEGIVPCVELQFHLDNERATDPVAIPPQLIVGLVAGLSSWLAQIQGGGGS